MFLHRSVQTGLLPVMLSEILDTRVMVKKSMQRVRDFPVRFLSIIILTLILILTRMSRMLMLILIQAVYKALDSRQLGLKMLANVTFDCCSSFSFSYPQLRLHGGFLFRSHAVCRPRRRDRSDSPRNR